MGGGASLSPLGDRGAFSLTSLFTTIPPPLNCFGPLAVVADFLINLTLAFGALAPLAAEVSAFGRA